MTADNDGSCSKPVAFIVTGFGPFRNAQENPTTVICNHLMKHLNGTSLACRTTTRVMETSAQAARAELDTLELSDSTTTVMLHLGVNYKGTQFQLEQCAYNDATFRIPDEQGYQPRNLSIVPERTFNTCLKTLLNVNDICSNMNDLVFVSTDPGRFVCNYTYFYSLNKTQALDKVHSLFLHVPPFSVIQEEEQMSVVVKLMQCIDQQLVNASQL
jgi:pyroglutamyl-peptidase